MRCTPSLPEQEGAEDLGDTPMTTRLPPQADQGERAASGGMIQSVQRALCLLRALSAAEDGLSLSALAREAGLAVSTTHRLLTTLEHEGFAHAKQRNWHVGPEAFSVGAALLRHRNFGASAAPALRYLRTVTRETANLGILHESEIITVSQLESRELVRSLALPGGRTPALNSGMGKAILAQWSGDEISRYVSRYGLRPMTSRSLLSLEAIKREFELIRQQGFAEDLEENRIGVCCIAAPVFGLNGEPMGAISVSGPAGRFAGERRSNVGRIVREVANGISTVLGSEVGGGKHDSPENVDREIYSG